MKEQELISKLKKLKQIKPRQEWVFLAKQELFGEKAEMSSQKISASERFSIILDVFPRVVSHLNYKYAFATLVFMFLMMSSVFIYAQNALPGDTLFAIKKLSEKTEAVLTFKNLSPENQLSIANKRLDELSQIAKSNQSQKLAPAIREFQASAKEAAINIKNMSSSQGLNKEIVAQAKKLAEAKKDMEIRGVVIGEIEELDNALAGLIKMEIEDLENSILTATQDQALSNAKTDFQNKQYSDALEKILELTQQ